MKLVALSRCATTIKHHHSWLIESIMLFRKYKAWKITFRTLSPFNLSCNWKRLLRSFNFSREVQKYDFPNNLQQHRENRAISASISMDDNLKIERIMHWVNVVKNKFLCGQLVQIPAPIIFLILSKTTICFERRQMWCDAVPTMLYFFKHFDTAPVKMSA